MDAKDRVGWRRDKRKGGGLVKRTRMVRHGKRLKSLAGRSPLCRSLAQQSADRRHEGADRNRLEVRIRPAGAEKLDRSSINLFVL